MINLNKGNILANLKTIYLRQLLVAVMVVTIAFLKNGYQNATLWFIGCGWALGDMLWMFYGVQKGMKLPPERSQGVMRRNMLERLAIAVALVFVMLRLKLSVFELFISFLLLHIALIINLIIIACRKN